MCLFFVCCVLFCLVHSVRSYFVCVVVFIIIMNMIFCISVIGVSGCLCRVCFKVFGISYVAIYFVLFYLCVVFACVFDFLFFWFGWVFVWHIF